MTKEYDARYYYQQSSSRVQYGTKPSGNLSLNRFLQQQPYWVQPGSSTEFKKKRIIIADWSIRYWSDNKRIQVASYLEDLLEAGFNISLNVNRYGINQLVSIEPGQASIQLSPTSHNYPEKLETPVAADKIKQQLCHENEILPETVAIIDDQDINIAIGLDTPTMGHRGMVMSELFSITEHNKEKNVKEVLSTLTPSITHIILDTFYSYQLERINRYKDYFGINDIFKNYQDMYLSNEQMDKLKEDGEIIIEGATLNSSDLTNLQNFQSSSRRVNITSLLWILNQSETITELNLIQHNLTIEALETVIKNKEKVKSIVFSMSAMQSMDLIHLASQYPNTHKIVWDLDKSKEVFQQYYLSNLSQFNCLNQLHLKNISIPSLEDYEKFVKQINSNEKLNSLIMSGWVNFTNSMSHEVEVLDKINHLYLNNVDMSVDSFSTMLCSMPNLQTLDFVGNRSSSFSFNNSELSLAPNSLPYLKKLTLSHINIEEKHIKSILEAAPNIEIIDFSNAYLFTKDGSLQSASLSLPNLKAIKLSSGTKRINKVLSQSKNLLSIECERHHGNHTIFDDEVVNQWRNLRKASLKTTIITNDQIKSLVTNNPELTALELTDCRNRSLQEPIDLPEFSQPLLAELVLDGNSISCENMAQIIKRATQLETLDVYALDDMSGLVLDEGVSLDHLTSLQISANEFDLDVLNDILERTPNLVNLQITCAGSTLGRGLYLNSQSLPKLKHIDISSSYNKFIKSDLDALIEAAPNLESTSCLEKLPHEKTKKEKMQATENLEYFNARLPQHRADSFKDYKPNKEGKYKFKNNHGKVKSQLMMIDKTCRYFQLSKSHTELIPKIQDGMCNALSHLYLSLDSQRWLYKMELLRGWQGDSIEDCPQELLSFFDDIRCYIEDYQINQSVAHSNFLGDGFYEHLQQSHKDNFILSNNWHAVGLKKLQNGSYEFYDPNNPKGFIICDTQQSLREQVKNSLGELVCVNSFDRQKYPSPSVALGSFIKEGGLLTIPSNLNCLDIMNKFQDDTGVTQDQLEGILLRNTAGKPAWYVGLRSHSKAVNNLSARLLENFIITHPNNCVDELYKSMACLNSYARFEMMAALIPLIAQYPRLTILKDAINNEQLHETYEKALTTWDKKSEKIYSIKPYMFHLFSDESPKQLIELGSNTDLLLLQQSIFTHAKDTSKPIFVINSADDLVCSAPFIKRNEDDSSIGVLTKGPGGPLYDFLQEHEHNSPTLLINYDNFTTEEIIKFNALLDSTACVDGTQLPEHTQIIGLQNIGKMDCYQGSDFYSRFDVVSNCPLSRSSLQGASKKLSFMERQESNKPYEINLYHKPNWKETLLGEWVLDGDSLIFQEGELSKAMKTGLPIQINQGFFGEHQFDLFIANNLPEDTVLIKPEEQYDWEHLCQAIEREPQTSNDTTSLIPYVLNPSTLSDFFCRYECDDNKRLNKVDGIIAAQGKTEEKIVNIHLTREISEDDWALIANTANHNHVICYIKTEPGVPVPSFLKPFVHIQGSPDPALYDEQQITEHDIGLSTSEIQESKISSDLDTFWAPGLTESSSSLDQVIVSTDADVTIAQIKALTPDAIVINVSELISSDLLGTMDGFLNQATMKMEFEKKASVLLRELQQGKNIILTGKFSDELSDMLAPLILQRTKTSTPVNALDNNLQTMSKKDRRKLMKKNGQGKGKKNIRNISSELEAKTDEKSQASVGKMTVICNSREKNKFSYHPNKKTHHVSIEEKRALLVSPSMLSDEQLQNHSLSQLEAITFASQRGSVDPWLGMKSIGTIQFDVDDFQESTAPEDAQAFSQHRKNQLNSVLKIQPYVFISGVSGVGKSTFVKDEFGDENDVLFDGEESLHSWARSVKKGERVGQDKRKILFIDEANLSHRQWSEFEGLFQTPKTLLIDGEIIELSDNHKIIFAGNPLSYGDERTQPALFEHHGNAVLFEPLSKAVLFEKVIKPVFINENIPTDAIKHILNIYQTICQFSTTEILISPRELQMMALLIRNHPNGDDENIIKSICYDIAINCVPTEKREDFNKQYLDPRNRLDDAGKFGLPIDNKGTYTKIDGFTITPSRQSIASQIDAFLHLREFRQLENNKDNPAITKGGLGGLILEGEPGIGKTVQVIKQLRHLGYEQELDLNNPTNKAKPYYILPVSMPYIEKEKLLLKAFDEGAVVMIDEINASPMMERLLNDLLMGQRPNISMDNSVETKPKPGFMVIGTQNPITMSGRRAPSTALQRRMITSIVPDYTHDELMHILINKGLPAFEANAMVDAYQSKLNYAKQYHLEPRPTFRHLETLLHSCIKSLDTSISVETANDKNDVVDIEDIDVKDKKNVYPKRAESFRFFKSAKEIKQDDKDVSNKPRNGYLNS